MKTNELRVGNLIYSRNGVVKTVDVINDSTQKIEFDDSDDDYRISDCEPIPLTEEWLLKFGLGKFPNRKDLFNCFGYTILLTQETPMFYIGVAMIEIKSVHQFQNLYFALTGEELTIKL